MKSIEEMAKIQALVNEILIKAKGEVEGSINWGDLRCVGVRCYLSVYGDEGVEVFVDCDSGWAYELRCFVSDKLFDRGYTDIKVFTEW